MQLNIAENAFTHGRQGARQAETPLGQLAVHCAANTTETDRIVPQTPRTNNQGHICAAAHSTTEIELFAELASVPAVSPRNTNTNSNTKYTCDRRESAKTARATCGHAQWASRDRFAQIATAVLYERTRLARRHGIPMRQGSCGHPRRHRARRGCRTRRNFEHASSRGRRPRTSACTRRRRRRRHWH